MEQNVKKTSFAKQVMKKAIIAFLILSGLWLLLTIGHNAYDIVPIGEGGVLVTLGKASPKTKHGLVIKVPLISEVLKYSTRQQSQSYDNLGLKTADLQNVFLSCTVIYQINDENLPKMVQQYNMDRYVAEILSPKVEAAFQDAVGKNDVWLLVTEKQTVTDAIAYIINDKLNEDSFLIMKDVLLKAPVFEKKFEDEILAKLTEEVKLEKAKIQTQIAYQEAEQMLAKASVDPKVVEQMSKAITNPLIIKYEAMKALNKWKGDVPSTFMNGTENALPFIGVSK